MTLERFITWQFSGSIAQVVGVPTPIGFKINFPFAGWRVRIRYFRLFMGTLGAPRAVLVRVFNSDDGQIYLLGRDSLDTSQMMYLPSIRTNTADQTTERHAGSANPVLEWIIHPNYLQIEGASLADTEVMNLDMEMELDGGFIDSLPSISAVGAGITLTTDQNRWI